MEVWFQAVTRKFAEIVSLPQNKGAHGLIQYHTAVRNELCVTLESGFDFGTAHRNERGACRIYGDNMGYELIHIRKVFVPEIFSVDELLEHSSIDGQI